MEKVLHFINDNKIESILDIGANVGNFSRTVKVFFPNADILMFEANPFCDNMLKMTGIPYQIACLSDEEKDVKFYVQDDNMVGTGASYYLEKTRHYSLQKFITTRTKKLDDVLKLEYNDKSFDMIKLDTQGSEIDIMRGGPETVKKAKFLLIELSLKEYNINAPLKNDVETYTHTLGFKPVKLVEEHYVDGQLVQEDWIFSR